MNSDSFTKRPVEPNKEAFHAKMNKVIHILEKHGIELRKMNALEVFGRAGDWHTIAYANKVKSLEVWEIDKRWEKELEKKLRTAKIKICDSINTVIEYDNPDKFDLIVIDNPMNTYGPKSENGVSHYCEHFDIINHINKIMAGEGIVIFNVNRHPFDYEKSPLWKKRREEFYNVKNTDNMNVEFLLNFYKELFRKIGFETVFHFYVVRHKHLDYFVYRLKSIIR